MADPGKRRILIVDDDPEFCEVVAFHVKELCGYGTAVAHNAKDAFDMARREGFDVVIVDVRMPGEDGMGLLARVQGLPAPRPRVIIVSGLSRAPGPGGKDRPRGGVVPDELLELVSNELVEDDVREKGGVTFLPKPLDYKLLVATLRRLLESASPPPAPPPASPPKKRAPG